MLNIKKVDLHHIYFFFNLSASVFIMDRSTEHHTLFIKLSMYKL